MPFLLFLMFFLQQNWRRGEHRVCMEAREVWGGGGGCRGGEMAQTMYAHMNKCIHNFKNNKKSKS
jgi:hypothetical protein